MKKTSLSFLLSLLLVAMFATAAIAAPQEIVDGINEEVSGVSVAPTNDNANNTAPAGIDDQTGAAFGDVIKSNGMTNNLGVVGDQKTHGSYQNNTNSCASCHQTHTAKARQLLFSDSAFNTCAACHDGTLGFYNVFKTGTDYFGTETTGGTFGGTHDGNMSIHLATGAVTVGAAPGGSNTSTGAWGGVFSCASCHAPHGSYSSRLLHYNPANMGNTAPTSGGKAALGITVVDYAYAQDGAALGASQFKAVRGVKANFSLTDSKYDAIAADDVVIVLYELKATTTNGITTYSYAKTMDPWLYGYTTTQSGRDYFSRLYTVTADQIGTVIQKDPGQANYNTIKTGKNADVIDQNDYSNGTGDVMFKYDKGLIYANKDAGKTLLNNAKSAEIGRAYTVALKLLPVVGAPSDVVTKHEVQALWASGTQTPGSAVSTWCTTCHVDYLYSSSNGWNSTGSRTSVNGNQMGEAYYGHTTSSNSYTCLRCHYAHGTDVEIMLDANSNSIFDLQKAVVDGGKAWTAEQSKAYMIDKNSSSALKKYTNQAVCWACHNSSKAGTLKNTNRDAEHPTGLGLDPSQK